LFQLLNQSRCSLTVALSTVARSTVAHSTNGSPASPVAPTGTDRGSLQFTTELRSDRAPVRSVGDPSSDHQVSTESGATEVVHSQIVRNHTTDPQPDYLPLALILNTPKINATTQLVSQAYI
jgi:hypothetical protein